MRPLGIIACFTTYLAVAMISTSADESQDVPIIGVLTQVLRDYKRFTDQRHLHLAASYVKWIESSGAQVLPILLNQNDSYYEKVFQQTNGLLFPGGDNLLNPEKNTPMMVAAKKLYKLAVDSNNAGDYYPIWGTCLGFQLLSVLTSSKNVLVHCSATDVAMPVDFVDRGRLFAPRSYAGSVGGGDFSKEMMNALIEKNLTYNYHHNCLTDDGLKEAELVNFYRPLAYSTDLNGTRFIAIFEAIDYPFYGVQFHPEKAPFEFTKRRDQRQLGHSREAIAATRYFGDFFVEAAGKSKHLAKKNKMFRQELIYAVNPMYTGLKRDMYEQRYLFPFESNESTTTEEFLDYVPGDNETAPERV